MDDERVYTRGGDDAVTRQMQKGRYVGPTSQGIGLQGGRSNKWFKLGLSYKPIHSRADHDIRTPK